MYRRLLLFVATLFFISSSYCQEPEVMTETWDDNVVQEKYSNFQEDIEFLRDHPVDLNSSDLLDFIKIPYLSDNQKNALYYYRLYYGEIFSMNELYAIEGFDYETIKEISPFIKLSDKSHSADFEHALKKLRTEVYSGINGISNIFRLVIKNQTHVSSGLSVKRVEDGTPLQLCGHLSVKDVGILKSLIIGDFKLHFGQGLTFSQSSGFFSATGTGSLNRAGAIIRPYKGMGFSGFSRGLAGSVGDDRFVITGFFADLHQDSVVKNVRGMNIKYRTSFMNIGVTTVKSTGNINGIDANLWWGKVNYFGEACLSGNGVPGFVSGVSMQIHPRFSFVVQYRNYPSDFSNSFAQAMNSGGKTSNEKGLGAIFNVKAFQNFDISSGVDYARFPWFRYRTDAPSSAQSFWMKINGGIGSRVKFFYSFTWTRKEQNRSIVEGQYTPELENLDKESHQVRLQLDLTKMLVLKTRIAAVTTHYGQSGMRNGFVTAQDIIMSFWNQRVKCHFRFALYCTDSYDERIYLYEDNLPLMFGFPSYYGSGSRFYSMLEVRIFKGFSGFLKYADKQDYGSSGSDKAWQCSMKINF